jgi:voltage-dependent calcium channel alpha-2/delta-3
MEIAENSALSESDKPVESDYRYYNAIEIIEPADVPEKAVLEFDENGNQIEPVPPETMILTENQNFFNLKVNLSHSVVQVPTSVYDRATEVIKAIKWSEALDQTFVKNYRDDPSLSWQFFGSTTGILRQYPGKSKLPSRIEWITRILQI